MTRRRLVHQKKKRHAKYSVNDPKVIEYLRKKMQKNQLPPVIETGTLGYLACAAIPRSTTELKKLV
jgi:hypothetical protein